MIDDNVTRRGALKFGAISGLAGFLWEGKPVDARPGPGLAPDASNVPTDSIASLQWTSLHDLWKRLNGGPRVSGRGFSAEEFDVDVMAWRSVSPAMKVCVQRYRLRARQSLFEKLTGKRSPWIDD